MIFNFCYQIGVFLSRSSLSVVKIERVWLLSLLQLCNFLFFGLNAFLVFCTNIYVLFAITVFVGLMGGATYVNVVYLIKQSPKLAHAQKELAMTLCSVFMDLGILLATVTSLVLTTTRFKS